MSSLKGFQVARGEPDIRGWEVRTLNGRDVGEVDDLLVDPESGEVVFMEVAMNNSDRHIELALRFAQLDREKKHVIVDSGDIAALGSEYDLPETSATPATPITPVTTDTLSPEMRADTDDALLRPDLDDRIR